MLMNQTNLNQTIDLNQQSVLTLFITCESSSSERRFDKSISIATLKERLEPITGVPASSAKLILYNENTQVAIMDCDEKMLGFYPVYDFMRIEVVDLNPHRIKAQYTDVSKVEKFELTAEEYNKKTDTVRAFKERNKLGRFADNQMDIVEPDFEVEAKAIKIGDRCIVELAINGMQKRASVMFVGKTNFKLGYWVGVKYDEPVGKHNGTVEGVSYFECANKYGAMVRPNKLTIGDYPEEDLDFESDDEEM